MKINDICLSLKMALRELRQGWRHFSVFIACLVLGVAIMASVNTFGSIVKLSLQKEAQSLLGGDIEIRLRSMGATSQQRQFIESYGQVSYAATLRSMLHFNDQHTLVEIKAIDEAYPLLGTLAFNEPIIKENVFSHHGIAVDQLLLSQLGLKIGDEVNIGEASYIIRATLKTEPDRAVQIFSFGPRVMMSHESLAASKLVSTFSLIEHRYRVVVPNQLVDETYKKNIEDELKTAFPDTSWRVSIGTDGNLTLKRFLDQLLAFMTLSGLATFLIAGIGIGSSARVYLEKKSQTIAVLKVQGASRNVIFTTYALVLGILALAGGIAGIAIAMMLTTLLTPLLVTVLPTLKGHSGIYLPASFLALWYGILISYLFSMPALLSAINVRPSVLFRSKIASLPFRSDNMARIAVGGIGALLLVTLFINANDKIFITGAMLVIAFAFLLFGLCTLCVKKLTRNIKVKTPWLKLALGNINRPDSATATVVFAIGISLTVLIALSLTEANFQARIKQLMEEKAPSLFLIDIQPHQTHDVQKLLLEYADTDKIMLYPMVRGRITAIDGAPVEQRTIDEDIDWAVRGDRGLSYSAAPPPNANIVKGTWWPQEYHGKPLLSVDERFLSGMNIDIGDTLTVNILGEDITAEIASAREIDYSTFQMNFALMFSPGVIEDFPHTSLATIHMDKHSDKEFELIARVAKEFPSVSAFRTKEVVELVQNITQHIARALRVTVAISLLAGLLVLTSALSATIEQRMYDVAILKVLGARRSDILKSCTAEWMLLAIITSFIAATIGTFGAWLINARLRGQEFYLMPHVTIATITACILLIWIIGYVGNRRLFNFRPSHLLRNE